MEQELTRLAISGRLDLFRAAYIAAYGQFITVVEAEQLMDNIVRRGH